MFSRAIPEPNSGCWLWEGGLCTNGYAQIMIARRYKMAHVVCYKIHRGDYPDGLELDHHCRVRSCINPDHLEPVTKLENMRRARVLMAPKTHCKNGHLFTPDNIYSYGDGRRHCRNCIKDASAKRYAATKGSAE